MLLIAHRGNVNGADPNKENRLSYLEDAINKGYQVELDVRMSRNQIYTGHDKPLDLIPNHWLVKFKKKLWIHCKDVKSLNYFANLNQYNYFWHDNDAFTITSKGFILSHVNNKIKELSGKFVKINFENKKINGKIIGIMSDYLLKY
jgi:hypothetical protein